MGILTKDELLGASDLVTREVPLPELGGSVVVRSLPASYSNEASSASLEMVTDPRTGRQTAKADTAKLEELQVYHGVINPKFDSIDEVKIFSTRVGASWQLIVRTINEISGLSEEDVKRTEALFQSGGPPAGGVHGDDGVAAGNGRSDLPASTGA